MSEISGCDADFREEPTEDSDVDLVVLFASVDESDVEALTVEWKSLFNAT